MLLFTSFSDHSHVMPEAAIVFVNCRLNLVATTPVAQAQQLFQAAKKALTRPIALWLPSFQTTLYILWIIVTRELDISLN